MMPAAKHFDPIVGIDVHIVQPPGPVPPLPVPHPFIGMVIDEFDYVPIIGATVFVNNVPRAQAGTAGKNIPSHIPIGGVFVKPPANEAELFMGSITVEVDGDAMSHMAHPVISCHDIGMVPPFRPKGKVKTHSMVLPTSVVLPIPMGAPVLVGGPPTISIMALGMRFGMAALGKAFRKVKSLRKAKKAKAKAKGGKLGKKGKSKGNTPCGTDAHPVDLVTGACVDDLTDYDPPGHNRFRWERHYDSAEAERSGPMGRGFRHCYEVYLEALTDGFKLIDEWGEETLFPLPTDEYGSIENGMLLRVGLQVCEIVELGQRTLRFARPKPGAPKPVVEIYRDGATLSLFHDPDSGHLNWARDSSGTYQIDYDSSGRLTAVCEVQLEPPHEPITELLRFEYDSQACLTRVTDGFGQQSTYSYDRLRLTKMTDRRGYSFVYLYDAEGRVVHTRGDDGLWDARFAYLPAAGMTRVTYADGGEWTTLFDESGTVTEQIAPDGGMMTRRCDENGNTLVEVDAAGRETQFVYDGFGGLNERIDSFGISHPPAWVDDDNIDPLEPEFPTTAVEWECGGSIEPDEDDTSPPLARHLAQMPRELLAGLSLDQTTPRVAAPRGDVMGRLLEETTSDGARRTWEYDSEGNVVEETDRDGASTRRHYTSWNLIGSETQPNGAVTQFGYSIRGEIARIVDPGGTETEYRRDHKQRITGIRRHGEVRETYVWDEGDTLIEKRDADGNVLMKFELDDRGLPIVCHLGSGGCDGSETFEYDDDVRIVKAGAEDIEITREFDEDDGQLLADLRNGRGVTRASTEDATETTTVLDRYRINRVRVGDNSFDIVDPLDGVHTVTSLPSGVVLREHANGDRELSCYRRDGRCLGKSLVRREGVQPVWSRRFEFSLEGELRRIEDSETGTTTHDYDAAHRLIRRMRPDAEPESIGLDAAGNVLSMPGLGGVELTTGNRVASANGDTFTYGQRNHIASRQGPSGAIHYHYDAADRLVRIERPTGDWRATYDPLGRRVRKDWEDGAIEYHWDGGRLAAEEHANGFVRVYVYAHSEAWVPFLFIDYPDEDSEGMRRYLYTDAIGTPIRVEDDARNVLWVAQIDPYGRVHVERGNKIQLDLRFPGHIHDPETGLHYNRHRYYSPELGRYLQSDPIGAEGGVNVYAYPANPVADVDVIGLKCGGKANGAKKGGKGEGIPLGRKGGKKLKNMSKRLGMDKKHIKRLQRRASKNDELIIIRGSNRHSRKWQRKGYDGKPTVAKPVDCKLKTAKAPDPDAGLVKKGPPPDDVAPDGYKFDDGGVLRKEPDGNAVRGDYDLQNVSKKDANGNYKGVDTNEPGFKEGMNNDVCPKEQQFQHGANDDFKPNGDVPPEAMGRQPDADEDYLVVEPDGTAKEINGTDNLKQYYDDNGMTWPYE